MASCVFFVFHLILYSTVSFIFERQGKKEIEYGHTVIARDALNIQGPSFSLAWEARTQEKQSTGGSQNLPGPEAPNQDLSRADILSIVSHNMSYWGTEPIGLWCVRVCTHTCVHIHRSLDKPIEIQAVFSHPYRTNSVVFSQSQIMSHEWVVKTLGLPRPRFLRKQSNRTHGIRGHHTE